MAFRLMAAGAALAALALALPATATVLYSTNFAAPTFTTGALAGQGGWGVFGLDNNNPDGVTVQTTVTDQGEPAVDFGLTQATAYYLYGPVTPTKPVTVSIDIYEATNGSGLNGTLHFGAISSAETFDSSNQVSDRAAGVYISSGGGVNPLSVISPLTHVPAFTWYNLSMTLDYSTQTYDIALDGEVLASDVPFCGYETDDISCTGVQASQFEGVALSVNGVKSGSIYFGDVSISEVPEPGAWTLTIAGAALTGLALRTRRRAPCDLDVSSNSVIRLPMTAVEG